MPTYQLYPTKEGWLALGIVDEGHFWTSFADTTGLHRYRDWSTARRTLLGPFLKRPIRQRARSTDDWMKIFTPLGLPITPVRSVEQSLREPQFNRVVHNNTVLPPLPCPEPRPPSAAHPPSESTTPPSSTTFSLSDPLTQIGAQHVLSQSRHPQRNRR